MNPTLFSRAFGRAARSVMLYFVLTPLLSAQTPVSPTGPPLRARVSYGDEVCFRGRPLLTCQRFWITEFGVAGRLDAALNHRESPPVFTWELGHMVNVSRRSAFGGSVLLAAVDEGARVGIRSRYRRWLRDITSLDLSAGLFLGGISDRGPYAYPRFTGTVAINFGDWFALSVHVDQERFRDQQIDPKAQQLGQLRFVQVPRTDLAWRVGASLGSYGGAIVGTAGPLILFIWAVGALSGWNCCGPTGN